MSTDDRVQSVRNAWTNALRAEVLRVGRRLPEVARVVTVGMWIATYADADGSNAYPGRDTLATLSGCSQETVTRAVKVLTGVGVLARKRRPNASAMYQLLMPLGGGLDWASHIHHMTETRQRKAYAKKKEQAFPGDRTASVDAVRTATTDRVPDSVRVGGSGQRPWTPSEVPDSVHGRPRTASVDAFRTASTDAPTSTTPNGDPLLDHDMADHSPQPPPRAGEAVEDESSPSQAPLPAASAEPELRRCTACRFPIVPDPQRPDRTIHAACGRRATTDHERHSA